MHDEASGAQVAQDARVPGIHALPWANSGRVFVVQPKTPSKRLTAKLKALWLEARQSHASAAD